MNDVVMGPKQDGQGSGYVLVHTGSKHMAADIYTKSFTDKATFGNLNQLINVFKPDHIGYTVRAQEMLHKLYVR